MRISYNWLKDYIDVKLPPEELKDIFTMSGLSVESVARSGDDHLFEIEVTSNRPDWLSVIGVARELAALTGKKLKLPPICHCERPKGAKQSKREIASAASRPRNDGVHISVKVEDKALCPKYTGRVIRGVTVGESPAWLKRRLEAMGLRAINNIVDITNFCLFETGEPMHAFDLDRIDGAKVIVRRAHSGERLTTLDGVERNLDSSTIVIADASRPIALAGVMGGLATEVTVSTKNILLEAASFDPVSIRRTSRKFSLSTESSYRFERKVALDNIAYASDRAARLIAELAGGRIETFFDVGERTRPKRPVEFRPGRLNAVLGIDIPLPSARRIITALGMKIRSAAKGSLKIEIPGSRNDLNSEIDIIEEVARVYGYDRIPETIPDVVDQPVRLETDRIVERNIRSTLTSDGACEVITYGLVSKRTLSAAMLPSEDVVEICNPLSGEQEAMRSSLLPGVLNTVLWNINRKKKDLKIFEIGNIYTKNLADTFNESKHLAIAITGDISSGWVTPPRSCTFYDLKGIVESVLAGLGIEGYSFTRSQESCLSGAERASIDINGQPVGIIGEIAGTVTGNFDIKDKVYFCEMAVAKMLKYAQLGRSFKALARHPSVKRDISILVDKDIMYSDLAFCIVSSAGKLLKNLDLVDRYSGKQVPEGSVSLTCRLEYQDPERTLEDKDILDAQGRVIAELGARFGAKLR